MRNIITPNHTFLRLYRAHPPLPQQIVRLPTFTNRYHHQRDICTTTFRLRNSGGAKIEWRLDRFPNQYDTKICYCCRGYHRVILLDIGYINLLILLRICLHVYRMGPRHQRECTRDKVL